MPTLQQLVTEITTESPFKDELAPFWADVFPVESEPQPASFQTPEQYQAAMARYKRVNARAGILKPDAAHAIHAVLNDPTRRTRVEPHVSRGIFLASISSLAFSLIGKAADEQDAALGQGLMTQEQRDSMKGDTTITCSRSDELGWESWPYTLVVEAKASVS